MKKKQYGAYPINEPIKSRETNKQTNKETNKQCDHSFSREGRLEEGDRMKETRWKWIYTEWARADTCLLITQSLQKLIFKAAEIAGKQRL